MIFSHADDLIIFINKFYEFIKISELGKNNCLNINEAKTIIVIFLKSLNVKTHPQFHYSGSEIEIGSSHNYLGITFTNTGKFRTIIRNNKAKANTASNRGKQLLQKAKPDSREPTNIFGAIVLIPLCRRNCSMT